MPPPDRNRAGILGSLIGGLFDPEEGSGLSSWEASGPGDGLGPKSYRQEVLDAIAGRYGQEADLGALLSEARSRYGRALEDRGLALDSFIDPESGERIKYPEVSFSNPYQRAIAMRVLEEKGGDALEDLDYGYSGYRLDPELGYGDHILPPGYADLLEAERDYDILSKAQQDVDNNMLREFEMLEAGVPAYATSSNLNPEIFGGRAYYPRYSGTGLLNAMASGGESGAGTALNAMSTVPNSIAYAADSGRSGNLTPSPFVNAALDVMATVPGSFAHFIDPEKNPAPMLLDGLKRGLMENERAYRNQSLGRNVPMGQVPIGQASDASEVADERIKSLPPTGTDFARNISGGYLSAPVWGDVFDLGREFLDPTPMTGALGDVAKALARGGYRSAAKQLALEGAVDAGATAGIGSMLPPSKRTWNQYLFEPQPRVAPPPEEARAAALAPEADRRFGSPTESREVAGALDLTDKLGLLREYMSPNPNIPQRVRDLRARRMENTNRMMGATILPPGGSR